MNNIRITKIFKFEAAHALLGYDGLCKYVHGHSYILHVTILGKPNEDKSSPKLGMVMDFGDLKRIVNTEIIDQFDHSTVLSSDTPMENLNKVAELFDRKIMVDYQPTSENMLIDFAERIQKQLDDKVSLVSLKLYETANSYAEWFAVDNK